jgi:DNA-binding LacI/PurR family transcriptional regulator
MSVSRVRKLVEESQADAWVVVAGSSAVLECFSSESLPVFALFGRHEGLPIAAAMPNRVPPYVAAARRRVGLGHRRISILARRIRRLPEPGRVEKAFLEELKALGIQTGGFSLPEWDDTREGFEQLLNNLFRVTPPTALIAQEAFLFNAAHHFLSQRGLRIPQDVSLLCADSEPSLGWCIPPISHFRWESRPLVQRIVRWVANVSRGKTDLRQTLTPAEFVLGGTIGRVADR